jgi:threonine dehydratase
MAYCISPADVAAAAARVASLVHLTPVLTCASLDAAAGGREVYFKCELFQRSGSFKARGACNAVALLAPEAAAKGVCTHSSGNHAQALAIAARLRGIPAHIVMPSNAPAIKRRAVEGYGATVYECAPTQAAREAEAARVAAATGAEFVHPSEDPRVMAGAGTLALELLVQVAQARGLALAPGGGSAAATLAALAALPEPVLDAVIVPIGGGGMISGVATAVAGVDPRIRVIAAEPAAADDAFRSKAAGCIQGNAAPPATMADGLKTTLGPNTWPIVRDKVERVVCVSEAEIAAALRLVYERMKLAIEPSAAVGVAALVGEEVRALPGLARIAVVLCGGNADVDALPFGPATA